MPLMSTMGELTLSKLHYYSIGIVAQNKPLDSTKIEAFPVEEAPMADGDVTSKLTSVSVTGKDFYGINYNTNISAGNTITAEWFRYADGNRLTPPDVRRGEIVVIYQFGDADKYYWTTLRNDHTLRRLETVIWGFSANANEDTPVNSDNMYWLEVSTHRKLIHFHTSKANNEPFTYDIQINTGDGSIVIQDDIGNYIHLDSAENRIEFKNASGSWYDMHKENLTITIPKQTKIITEDFIVEASNSISETATNSHTVRSKTTATHGGDSSIIRSPDTTMVGSNKLVMNGNTINTAGKDISVLGGSGIIVASPDTTIA